MLIPARIERQSVLFKHSLEKANDMLPMPNSAFHLGKPGLTPQNPATGGLLDHTHSQLSSPKQKGAEKKHKGNGQVRLRYRIHQRSVRRS